MRILLCVEYSCIYKTCPTALYMPLPFLYLSIRSLERIQGKRWIIIDCSITPPNSSVLKLKQLGRVQAVVGKQVASCSFLSSSNSAIYIQFQIHLFLEFITLKAFPNLLLLLKNIAPLTCFSSEK